MRVLGENCKWKLILNGKEIELGAGLDSNLDSVLFNLLAEGEITIEKNQILFSKQTPLEIAENKVTEIIQDIEKIQKPIRSRQNVLLGNEDPDCEDIEMYYIPNSIGTTRALTELPLNGTKPLITPFNRDAWVKKKIADLNAGKNITTADNKNLQNYLNFISAEQLVEMEEESWPQLTEYGTQIHKIFETIFKDQEATNEGLEEDIFNSVVAQVKAFKQSLEAKYPGGKFYPELHVKTKLDGLSADCQAALTMNNMDSINGVIDLLVIDANGIGHIYDYKVSQKSISDATDIDSYQAAWNVSENSELQKKHVWGSAKKLSAGYQVEIYRNILEQYGIQVSDCRIVPIKLNLEHENENNPFEITKLTSVNVADESHQIFDPARKHKAVIKKLFVTGPVTSFNDIEQTNSIYNAFFVTDSGNKEQSLQEQIKYYKEHGTYVKRLDRNDRNYKVGEKEYSIRIPGMKKPVYCSATKVDETLSKHITALKDINESQYLDFAETVNSVLLGESRETLLGLVSTSQRNFIENTFGYYIDNNWQLISDERSHSIGLMIFKKGDRCEVVCLSSDSLRAQAHLSKGNSILGQTTSDKYINNRKILPALQGNLALMKAMIYIAQHQDTFKDLPILSVKAVNPWIGIQHSVTNQQLCENYNELLKQHAACGASKINSDIFVSDLKSLVEQSEELINGLDLLEGTENWYTAEWFQDRIEWFKRQYSKELNLKDGYQNTVYHNILANLQNGLLMARGFRGHVESDKGDYYSNHFFELDGLLVASPQYSSSANIRELGQAIDEYAKEVRRQIFQIGAPIQQALKKLYATHGTGAKVFDSWFADKENLILKDPDSHDFDGDPEAREALSIFLKTMCQLRHPDYNEQQLEDAKYDEDYYAIPLLEAKFSRQVRNIGIWSALKNKWKENFTVTRDLFMGDEDEVLKEGIEAFVSANQEIYNKLKYSNMDARKARLDKYGSGMCETDLEIVINAMLYSFCRSNVSKDYVPLIAALKTSLDRADTLGGTERRNMENIRKRFNDMVKTKFYGESIIPKQLQPLYKFLNLIKSGFTTMTLSLNVRSFLRETLQGTISGAARAGVKMYPGITEKYYIEGMTHVIQEAHKNFSGVSLLQQLNAVYGMANQSLSQVAGQRRLNWAHINHWGKDTLFLTATGPDFLHRMGLLVAKMKSDGSFEAHSIDDNGVLQYDWKKDKRFEHFANNETSHPDFLKEKTLYETMIDDFNKAGFKKADGSMLDAKNLDALPQAYTRTEGQSIKNYADLLYGHYDEESKSLLYDTLFGTVFMQYKTFLTSKLEQWTLKTGKYNVATLEQQFDENGNPLYVKFYEDESGQAHKDLLLQNEYEALSEDEKQKCRLYYDYNELPMQGMLQESVKVYKALLTMDQEKLNELWADPTTRAMFKLQIHDMWIMMLLTTLVTYLFGSAYDVNEPLNKSKVLAAARKAGVIDSLAYNVISGCMADSQLQNIISAFTTNPPVVSSLQRFATSSMKTITGDASIAWWLTKNIGMIGDFQGMAEMYNKK